MQDYPVSSEKIEIQPLKAFTFNNNMYISELNLGERLEIYNLAGQLVYQGTATAKTATIPLTVRGIYVIVAGERALKVW